MLPGAVLLVERQHVSLVPLAWQAKGAHLPWGKFNTSGDADTSCPSFQGCRDVDISCLSICRKVNPASFIFFNTTLSRTLWNSPISFAFPFILKLVAYICAGYYLNELSMML